MPQASLAETAVAEELGDAERSSGGGEGEGVKGSSGSGAVLSGGEVVDGRGGGGGRRPPRPSRPPPPPRLSGFSLPLHPLQVTAWLLFLCCVVVYFSLCIPFIPSGHSAEFYSFVFIYIGLFLIGFPIFLAVSLSHPYSDYSDSTDPPHSSHPPHTSSPPPLTGPAPLPTSESGPASNQGPLSPLSSASADARPPPTSPPPALSGAPTSHQLNPSPTPPVNPSSPPPPPPPAPSPFQSSSPSSAPLPRCPVCGAVQRRGTKHCYLDGRCVDGFDHHCVYLNLCVGQRNYHLFFAFVTAVTTLLSFQLFVTAWLLAHVNDSDYSDAVDSSRLSHPLAWLILLSIVSVLPLLCFVGISTLQCFHLYLVSTAQSTYSFIVKRRAMYEERRWEWEQRQRQLQQAQMQRWGDLGYPQQHRPPHLPLGPVIALSERQRREQEEWLKEQQRRAAVQQRSSARSPTERPQQPRPSHEEAVTAQLPVLSSDFIVLHNSNAAMEDEEGTRPQPLSTPEEAALHSQPQSLSVGID